MKERSSQKWEFKTPGVPDSLFLRDEEIPMTKEEIRSLVISKLRLSENHEVLDVGCGTGSVTVEMALIAKKVVGVDDNPKAVELTKANAEKFGVNVSVLQGHAPEALKDMGKFDRIFIGGGSDSLEEIIAEALNHLKNDGRIVIDAILLETATRAISLLSKRAEVEVTQVTISKGMKTKNGTAMISRNPVFIIAGEINEA